MSDNIILKNTQNADSRTATEELTKESLLQATNTHREEVKQIMEYMGNRLIEIGEEHDHTKIDYYDEFAENVLTPHTDEEFKKRPWYQKHIFEERHHLNADCPLDVNLFDVLEMIADCIAAGKGRAGHITPAYLELKDPTLLNRAYWNTIKLLDEITKIEE